jgi:S1-C subfamily serine protease
MTKFKSQLRYFILTALLAFLSNSVLATEKMLLENEKNSISIFQSAASSIVNVSNMKVGRGIFDMDATEVEAGMGSGFVWDKAGYLVTNFHVVDNGQSFLIAFKDDKKQYRAKLVGADPKKDIAVLKLDELPTNLNPIIVGESKTLQVGQKALAIGNPLGLDHTLTTGIISALDRKIRGYGGVSISGMIQTDAAINPGNSGGALLDSQGKLIGINAMIYNGAGAQSSAGLGFAIPVDTVKIIVPQLIKHGKVIRPGLGIAILEEYYAARFGVREGVVIKIIDPKGPSGKVGLRGIRSDRQGQYYLGDVIIGIDALPVKNFDDLYTILDKYKIGDKVKIRFIRDNKEKTVELTLTQV